MLSIEKMAKMREIEERRQKIEAERLKKEQEMLALLAEQEELKSKLGELLYCVCTTWFSRQWIVIIYSHLVLII